ncbi:hypothetical protein [Candidatus Hodgkinia cicadicola]
MINLLLKTSKVWVWSLCWKLYQQPMIDLVVIIDDIDGIWY